ncbi:unnamed protein product [Rhizoctonia solani]|uniref:F-box domain-containing protein n=1 Tax=Rhizoctonia solani TaxID=456999 RepID=A0A8H3D032_9AGAM|nr:unnamed protein product [Rhizoctonia solani]
MPDEILAEILLSAHPGDLLSLSQTCKLFRNTLMKESAANIWKSAERNVPHLPVYPWSDMAPHAYAALLFSKFCTSYGMPTLTEPDPYLLVRFCSSCREVKLAEISKIEIPNCSTNLLLQRIGFDLLPGRSDDLVAQDLENIVCARIWNQSKTHTSPYYALVAMPLSEDGKRSNNKKFSSATNLPFGFRSL